MVGALLVHVPPVTASLKESPVPTHRLVAPLIAAAGEAIVTLIVVVAVALPSDTCTTNASVPL